MALTTAGHALAARAPTLLSEWDIAMRKTQAAAGGSEKTPHVGFLATPPQCRDEGAPNRPPSSEPSEPLDGVLSAGVLAISRRHGRYRDR